MRSQASKPLPKKGALAKSTFRAASSVGKPNKKKVVSPKKAKTIANKSPSKSNKKHTSKNDTDNSNDYEDTPGSNKSEVSENIKASSSKTCIRNESPAKKTKKVKDKKETLKNKSVKKIITKKLLKLPKETKVASKSNKVEDENDSDDSDDIKYKLNNSDIVKKAKLKLNRIKNLVKKKSNIAQKKKLVTKTKPEVCKKHTDLQKDSNDVQNKIENKDVEYESESLKESKTEEKTQENVCAYNDLGTTSISTVNPEIPKAETERPLKFFTSSRFPRTVDIDVKCLKTSKGCLSVSERFLSMKCETKSEESTKDRNTSNTLVSQGPEIDVYTFTEKVDSPKSILSDFRSPLNKNIGRVRPIARVKGTVIDKKTESEKKKYSPHRPIEEVVKQLKASKRTEDLTSVQISNTDAPSDIDISKLSAAKEVDNSPKPIVSKSYKMVARKSSITGKPFSPIKFLEQESFSSEAELETKSNFTTVKTSVKVKKKQKKLSLSDDEINNSKFSFNTRKLHYPSSDESISESNDDNDSKESSESDTPKNKKKKTRKYKRITDSVKKSTSKELKELSKDSLIDLKDDNVLANNEKPSKRRLKLLSMWTGPKKHRMASLNAIAKVHCLYENESRTHMELGLMKTVERQIIPSTSKASTVKKKELKPKDAEKRESTSESEYENKKSAKEESSESSDETPPQRTLRGVPGIRSAGKYWDPKSSTSSSEDSELEYKRKVSTEKKKISTKPSQGKSNAEKPLAKIKKTSELPVKKKRNRNEVVMDLKDMVVQKRMASLNATAILAASYEKRSPKSSKDDSTSDSCSDESFSQKPKNLMSSGIKSETKSDDTFKKEDDDSVIPDRKQKVEVIVNQDTDVTITGVYSTHHHEGFCTVSGMQYRISSTSHTQTTATANCEKEGCSRDEGARYTPLSALSSMQPPAEHTHTHTHPVPEIGGLNRRAGCSSAFSAPTAASAHHDPGKMKCGCNLCTSLTSTSYGYYQPAGPLIKESGADAERALARYHPPSHYHPPHPPHPPMLQQYGPAYYPPELCYSPYYRPPGPYHMAPTQPDAQMVGGELYPPQYYAAAPCYQHSNSQRIPYMVAEYRGCSCPLNACPKNVLIGPATGKAPTGGGPADVPPALAPPGAPSRPKKRACVPDAAADAHGSGKDPPLAPEPPAAADAPHPCPLPAIGGASPKRELPYEVREMRLAGDLPGQADALGPPSPARGSAGACAPQPPPVAPRRARLGKAMARRSLAGDDTGLLLSAPQPANPSEADDDVLAVSPPAAISIDLSSSDERTTPLIDVKKENEGPTYSSPRKLDAQALKEHNSTAAALLNKIEIPEVAKATKRKYSKPKLEIDMKDVQLDLNCKTNGISEHVKLQKRRKLSEQTDATRPEMKFMTKKSLKTPPSEKKTSKRKLDNCVQIVKDKTLAIESVDEDPRLKNVAAVADEPVVKKHKSALLLDNLLRKNSIDRLEAKGLSSDMELNPAELFLPTKDLITNSIKKTSKKIDVTRCSTNGVRPNTLAAMSQLIEKKLASKNACKSIHLDSSNTAPAPIITTAKTNAKDDAQALSKRDASVDRKSEAPSHGDMAVENLSINRVNTAITCAPNESSASLGKTAKPLKPALGPAQPFDHPVESQPTAATDDATKRESDGDKTEKSKRCKLSEKNTDEAKAKSVEKVAKLLVSKKPAIKTDEATLVVEDACASPTPSAGRGTRGARRRRSGPRRARRAPAPPALPHRDAGPRAAPRWSNGWRWDGEPYVSTVYVNNDSRMDRTARCYARMSHASGDRVARGDCVLLRASHARAQPFVARVARLWENPDDGEMMMSLVWYYRPEHTELGRQPADAPDEVFASRHRDANSVACIEDKCFVLTFNEYCRYRKRLKAVKDGIISTPSIVPPMPSSEVSSAIATNDSKLASVSPELVLFCRKIYDFRSKKIQVPNK